MRKLRLLLRWSKILLGKSYFHVPQRLGKLFKPGELHGYFNDMTAKTNWTGLVDDQGIIINQLLDGSTCHFVTAIVQKGLGHHDRFLLTNDAGEFEEFLRICGWLVNAQDQNGGWEVAGIMNLKGPSKYSAMPQGEAISALVRAWKLTGRNKYLESARMAFNLLAKPVEEGGTSCVQNGEVVFEEYPAHDKNPILNGWIFALFGAYDYMLATSGNEAKSLFQKSLETLITHLPTFDSGYWSFYDEKRTMISSSFYHRLHIDQLKGLHLATGEGLFKEFIQRWEGYDKSMVRKGKAFLVKAHQKIKDPGSIVILR